MSYADANGMRSIFPKALSPHMHRIHGREIALAVEEKQTGDQTNRETWENGREPDDVEGNRGKTRP